MSAAPTLWLASRSPRRAAMLREADLHVRIAPPDIDDGVLRHGGVAPEWWVMSLAYLKARRVAEELRRKSASRNDNGAPADGWTNGDLVLGADTVCAVGRAVLGQPRDADDAYRMLTLMRGREHRTLTGICVLSLPRADWRLIAFDAAVVRVGDLTDDQVNEYLASGEWRSKAGAYNLSERIAAGWPIWCLGDPTTVMGLPMQRLPGWLAMCRS